MKKLFVKDKKLRSSIKTLEHKILILKSISQNLNYPALVRWNALSTNFDNDRNSSVSTSNRCVFSFNKKRLNKKTLFSRHIYLKLLRAGQVHGLQKSSW